jgi:DNA topoisomerase-1
MDDLTLEQALELFQLPRTVGQWEDGYPIKVAVGRFGPYVQYGAKKYASLKKEDDPYTITPERALEIIREKQQVEASRIIREFPEAGVQVLNGRYGPYITDGKKNGKIPKDREPTSLTLEECQALLAAAPERGTNRWGRKTAAKTAAKPAGKAAADAASASAPKKTARKKAAAPKKKAAARKKPAVKKTA